MSEPLTLEMLQEQLNALAEHNVELARTNAELHKQMQAVTSIVIAEPKSLPSIPKELLEYEGEEYKWNVAVFSFIGESEKITAEDASLDPVVIAKILAIDGQGLLTKQA